MPPASYCLCFPEFHKHIPTGMTILQSVFEGIKGDFFYPKKILNQVIFSMGAFNSIFYLPVNNYLKVLR